MPQNTFTEMIFKSRKVLLEILEQQDYNINDYKDFNLHETSSMIQAKQLDMILENSKTNKKNYIKYHLGKTLRPNNIQDYIEDLFYLENVLNINDDIIIVSKEEPNETILRYLVDIWENDRIFIRIISLKRLQFNILKHSLVPPHSIIKDEITKFKIEVSKSKNLTDNKN